MYQVKLLIALLVIVGGYKSNAATNDVFYVTSSGSKIDSKDAIISAAKGDLVYKCQPQESGISKSGTSLTVKNRKKKLTQEEILKQIEDLKKRAE